MIAIRGQVVEVSLFHQTWPIASSTYYVSSRDYVDAGQAVRLCELDPCPMQPRNFSGYRTFQATEELADAERGTASPHHPQLRISTYPKYASCMSTRLEDL